MNEQEIYQTEILTSFDKLWKEFSTNFKKMWEDIGLDQKDSPDNNFDFNSISNFIDSIKSTLLISLYERIEDKNKEKIIG